MKCKRWSFYNVEDINGVTKPVSEKLCMGGLKSHSLEPRVAIYGGRLTGCVTMLISLTTSTDYLLHFITSPTASTSNSIALHSSHPYSCSVELWRSGFECIRCLMHLYAQVRTGMWGDVRVNDKITFLRTGIVAVDGQHKSQSWALLMQPLSRKPIFKTALVGYLTPQVLTINLNGSHWLQSSQIG